MVDYAKSLWIKSHFKCAWVLPAPVMECVTSDSSELSNPTSCRANSSRGPKAAHGSPTGVQDFVQCHHRLSAPMYHSMRLQLPPLLTQLCSA